MNDPLLERAHAAVRGARTEEAEGLYRELLRQSAGDFEAWNRGASERVVLIF